MKRKIQQFSNIEPPEKFSLKRHEINVYICIRKSAIRQRKKMSFSAERQLKKRRYYSCERCKIELCIKEVSLPGTCRSLICYRLAAGTGHNPGNNLAYDFGC